MMNSAILGICGRRRGGATPISTDAFQFGDASGDTLATASAQDTNNIYIQGATDATSLLGESTGVGGGITQVDFVLAYNKSYVLQWIKFFPRFQNKYYRNPCLDITDDGRLYYLAQESSGVSKVRELSVIDGSTLATRTISDSANGISLAIQGNNIWVVGASASFAGTNLFKIPKDLSGDERIQLTSSTAPRAITVTGTTAMIAASSFGIILQVNNLDTISAPSTTIAHSASYITIGAGIGGSTIILLNGFNAGDCIISARDVTNISTARWSEITYASSTEASRALCTFDGTHHYSVANDATKFTIKKWEDNAVKNELASIDITPNTVNALRASLGAIPLFDATTITMIMAINGKMNATDTDTGTYQVAIKQTLKTDIV